MNSSHICLGCRRRLSQARAARAFQWQSRSSFISLSRATPPKANEKVADDNSKLQRNLRPRRNQSLANDQLETRSPRLPKVIPGDVLEDLFERSIQPVHTSPDTPQQPLDILEPYKNVERLKQLLAEGGNAADSWYFFLERFGPDAPRESLSKTGSPSYLAEAARELVKEAIYEKRKNPLSETLPSVTEISRTYLQLGLLYGSEWSHLMLDLLANIIKLRRQLPRDHEAEEVCILDLLGSWNVVCRELRNRRGLSKAGSQPFNWLALPNISVRSINSVRKTRGQDIAFGMLTPNFDARKLGSMSLIAAATFDILTGPQMMRKTLHDVAPLISTLAPFIATSDTKFDVGHPVYAEEVPTRSWVAQHVTTEWSAMRDRAIDIVKSAITTDKRSARPKSYLPVGISFAFIKSRLLDAKIRKDRRQVDILWEDVKQWPAEKRMDPSKDSFARRKGVLSLELCNYFILTYMELREPNSAIDVWNCMIDKGLSPDLTSWDAMLSGCKAARDWKGCEGIWAQMLKAGVQPDAICWTTRITILLQWRVEEALRALDEMGRQWLAAAKAEHTQLELKDLLRVTDVKGAAKPTIVTINAVITGLLRRGREEAVPRILQWAVKYGIQPNIVTYNTLLRPLVRSGNRNGMVKLINQMEKEGLKADVATFTTILDETFRISSHYSPEEQREVVDSIFDEMEGAGIQANAHTYGKIIYEILQLPEGINMVDKILGRMASQGLQPSPHIYTTMLNYHFAQEPPNLEAVRVLLDRVTREIGDVDHIFWDRVMEGYARAGDTASAVRILGTVTSKKNTVSWLTLGEIVGALVMNEEGHIAKSIVRNLVLDTGGPIAPGVRGQEGQHKFWDLARDLNLLDD